MKSVRALTAGITPAHAGKSYLMDCESSDAEDHPRTRGEKSSITGILSPKLGSPPHTRGKDTDHMNENIFMRITPAHAGKSAWSSYEIRNKKDHPRTRGEKACLP